MTTEYTAQRDIPEDVRALSTLPDADYIDMFTRLTPVVATPEQWARAMFGDLPTSSEKLIWRVILGLRLSPERSANVVAGWQVTGRGVDWIRLVATSSSLTGNLLVKATDEQVSLVTFLRYDRGRRYKIWPPLSAVHRALVPRILREAEARIARDADAKHRR